jgi:hypothetical protein
VTVIIISMYSRGNWSMANFRTCARSLVNKQWAGLLLVAFYNTLPPTQVRIRRFLSKWLLDLTCYSLPIGRQAIFPTAHCALLPKSRFGKGCPWLLPFLVPIPSDTHQFSVIVADALGNRCWL